MPPLETFDLRDDAVLWPVEGADSRGRLTRGEPVEVKVRWRPTTEDVQDANGQVVSITARAGMDREVPVDSWMWLGTLDDWYGEGSAGRPAGLLQVVRVDWAKDDKGRRVRYNVALKRSKDRLPDLAE
jgi:hypothetical protein